MIEYFGNLLFRFVIGKEAPEHADVVPFPRALVVVCEAAEEQVVDAVHAHGLGTDGAEVVAADIPGERIGNPLN